MGVAAVSNGKVDLRKDVGTVDEVDKLLGLSQMQGDRGIAQLRWATYGAPTKVNAQPHFGCEEVFFGAHNGNIHNYVELNVYTHRPDVQSDLKCSPKDFHKKV